MISLCARILLTQSYHSLLETWAEIALLNSLHGFHGKLSHNPFYSLSLCCVFLPHSCPHRVAHAIGQRLWKVGQWEGSCQAACALFRGDRRLPQLFYWKAAGHNNKGPSPHTHTQTKIHNVDWFRCYGKKSFALALFLASAF